MGESGRTLLIVRNPGARRAGAERELWSATASLRASGWEVDLHTTTGPGDATEIAAAAAAHGVSVVAACGGDGTVHEVVNGLAGTDTALAVIPGGTADVWAREAFVPRNAAQAFTLIPSARAERVDLGIAEGAFGRRYFLLMCGVGLDAEAVRRVGHDSTGKRRLGRAWYVAVAARVLLGASPTDATLTLDGASIGRPLLQALAGNTQLYGGVTRLTSGARIDDGLLDLCVFSGRGRGRQLSLALRALRGGLHKRAGNGVDYLRGERIEVRSERPLPVQADGEYIGETPVTLSVEPQSLTVMLGQRPNVLLGER